MSHPDLEATINAAWENRDAIGLNTKGEVRNAVDALVSLIEPLLIIMLGLGVGFLLAAVLIPIYDIASGIS